MELPLGRGGLVLSLLGSLTLLQVPSASPQAAPLNLPLSRLSGGSVHGAKATADGRWVVYAADQDEIGVVELFSVPADGSGTAVRISPPFTSSSGLRWDVTPDSRRTLYVVGTELYSVPIDGRGAPTRLSSGPVQLAGSRIFQISADGSRVVYLAGPSYTSWSLTSAPVDGSTAPAVLQAASTLGAPTGEYRVSPDGKTVVFPSNHADASLWPLYAVPIDGGRVVQLSQPVVGSGPFDSMDIRFSGRDRVVFLSAAEAGGAPELYSVPLDGSAPPVRLNGTLAPGGNVLGFELTADGARVVYLADQRLDGKQELFTVPADGSTPALVISAPLHTSGDVTWFAIHPGSQLVAYRADQELDGRFEVYGAPIDARRAPLKLSPPLSAGGNVEWSALTPDGRHLLVSLTPAPPFSDPYELWRVELTRGLPRTRLSESAGFQQPRVGPDGAHVLYVSGGVLHGVAISGAPTPAVFAAPNPPMAAFEPDGTHVLMLQRQESSEALELFRRRADAREPALKLNAPLVLGEVVADVTSFRTTPEGRWLVYHADGVDGDESPDLSDELIALRTDVRAPPVRLFPHPGILGGLDDVHEYRLDAAGERVVLYDLDAESEFFEGRLHAVTLDGGLAPVQLSSFRRVRRFEVSPDGAWVVFSVEMADRSERLLASRSDGTTLEVELSGALASRVRDFAPTPDSRSVVYLAKRLAGGADELLRVPIDGSAAPAPLGGPLVAGGNVQAFALDGQGVRVVYRADRETDGVDELWSVTLAGGTPTKLNGALVAGGDVTLFQLGADGARVVYVADEESDGTFEPFVVPSAGGAGTRLAQPFVAGGAVHALRLAPDDAALVYLAGAESPDVRELFVVPLDASTAPRKLSGALASGGDVQDDFEIASDGAHVVFRADARVDETIELFSARLGAPAPRVRLGGELAPGGDVRAFRISPDGWKVAYVADEESDERYELFALPTAGGAAPRRLSNALASDGDVRTAREHVQFHADSMRVFHIAEHAADEVHELFAGRFQILTRQER